MARKGWENLSDSYRARLIRGGVSKSAYESGASLYKARGKHSKGHERFLDRTNTFAKQRATKSKKPLVELRKEARTHTSKEHQRYLNWTSQARLSEDQKMQRRLANPWWQKINQAWQERDESKVADLWANRPRSLPKYMNFYHMWT